MTKHWYKVCAALLIVALVAVFTLTPSDGAQVAAHVQENPTSGPLHNEWSEQVIVVSSPDYDADNDGLIDIANLAQFNAIRWDLDGDGIVDAADYAVAFPDSATGMGCPPVDHDDDPLTSPQPVCTGYELTSDLDFDTNSNGRADSGDTYWDSGKGWDPIGGSNGFAATFEGNGHAISNLFIARGTADYVALFGTVASGGVVRNVGVADADVTGRDYVGALVGENDGRVNASYANGSVTGTDDHIGGLVGRNEGVIAASYSTASVSATGSDSVNAGGLVGWNVGAGASILAGYATGVVSGDEDVGGLVGTNEAAAVSASYSTGAVSGNARVGGLMGVNSAGTVTASYWDTERSGQETSAAGTGKVATELQVPTGHAGIYSAWNLDLDGDSANDNPWDFGADYNYPALSVDFNNDGTATWQEFGAQRRPGSPTISRIWREHGITASPVEILWVELNPPNDLGSGGIGRYEFRVGQVSVADPNAITWTPDNADEWVGVSPASRFGVGYNALHGGSYLIVARAVNDAPYPGGIVQYDSLTGAPPAPDLTLTPGDRSIGLMWSIVNAGEPLYTGFEVEYRPSGVGDYRTSSRGQYGRYTDHVIPSTERVNGTWQLISGEEHLINGQEYDVRVRAVVDDGTAVVEGEWAEETAIPVAPLQAAIPRSCPDDNLPRSLAFTPGNNKITATWMSADDDDQNLNYYILEYREQGTTEWTEWGLTSLDHIGVSNGELTWTATITGLNNGTSPWRTSYEVRVASVQITHDVNVRQVCDYTTPVAVMPDEIAVSITSPSEGDEYTETDVIIFEFSPAEYFSANTEVTVSVEGGEDFLIEDGDRTVIIAAGRHRALLVFHPDNDARNDEDATLTVTVKDGDGYSPGSPSSVSIALLDDDPDDLPVFDPDAPRVPGVPYTEYGTPPWLTEGDQQIAVEWGTPDDLGNPPLAGYLVQHREAFRYGPEEGWHSTPVRGTGTTTTITGLTNGTTYEVRVAAANDTGISEYTFPEVHATPVGPPTEPRNLTLSASDGEIRMLWDPPSNDGGYPVSGHSVQYRKGTTGEWTTVSLMTTTAFYAIGSLENDSEYQVQVAAVNDEGIGPYTSPSSATPTTVGRLPGVPRNLMLTPGNGWVEASWDIPTDQGNPALGDYRVQYRKTGATGWTTVQTGDATTSYTINDLENNVEYKVRVAAGNSDGQGGHQFGGFTSAQSATPSTKPSAPLHLMHDPPMTFEDVDGVTRKLFVVFWDAPISDGGFRITNYLVEYRRGTSGNWLSEQCVISGNPPPLTETCSDHPGDHIKVAGILGVHDDVYQVRVAAINSEGMGPFAVVSVDAQ